MRSLSSWALAAMIALLAVFSVLLLADDARAQPLQCGPADQVVELLSNKYGEELIGDGAGPNGTRLMVFAHPEGETWTVIGLMPDGTACFIATGTDWSLAPPGSET